MAGLKLEIVQEHPFSSVEEETLLNLLRTSDGLQRAFHLKTRKWGLTSTQYNVLRILRGARPHGLTCSAIGSRMITAEPDITRLLARLKALKLLRQKRDGHDRRVVWTHISAAGLALLNEMDPVIQRVPQELLGHLNGAELIQLIQLLELVRKPDEIRQAPVSCNGNEDPRPQVSVAGVEDRRPVTGPRPSEPQLLRPRPSE
jgi:DNA-binding MarR family transcriptional regulator